VNTRRWGTRKPLRLVINFLCRPVSDYSGHPTYSHNRFLLFIESIKPPVISSWIFESENPIYFWDHPTDSLEESMPSLALFIAVIVNVAGSLLIGFLLLLSNKRDRLRGQSTIESVPRYWNCFDLCKSDSGEAAGNCVGLCAYGWP